MTFEKVDETTVKETIEKSYSKATLEKRKAMLEEGLTNLSVQEDRINAELAEINTALALLK